MSRKWIPFVAAGAAALAAAGYYLYSTSRASAENVGYRVLEQDDPFELREYPELVIASTSLRAEDDAFLRLFRFIDGGNSRQEKIPMTTPVLVDGGHTMSFVLPVAVARAGAPAPASGEVRLSTRPAERVAACRFSGRGDAGDIALHLDRLRAWIGKNGLTVRGEPITAFYDSPMVPGFLRRNEVLLRLAD